MITASPASVPLIGALEPPTQRQGAQFSVAQAAPPFVLVFTPKLFDCYDLDGKIGKTELKGSFYLPTPIRYALVPGAANITKKDDNQDETVMYSDVESDGRKKRGEVWLDSNEIVPAAFLPPGASEGSYRRLFRVSVPPSDGVYAHYCTPWDTYSVVSPGDPAFHTFDKARFGLWLASLVLAGKIPGVHPALVARRVGRHKARILRTEGLALPDDVRKQRVGNVQTAYQRLADAKPLQVAA
jgi:hypothetical protein